MTTFKKFLALALALLMMAGAGVGVVATSAAETEGAYDDAINYLAALEVFKGYGNGDNGADDDILRYQMALFFVRVMTGMTEDSNWAGTSTFNDVKDYAGAIGYVEGLGVINGYGDGNFGPNDGIKYQDALVMAVRALEYDTENMSYPYGYISKAIQLGLTKGIKGVTYGETLTRGETAQIIYNVLNTPIYSQGGFVVDGNGFIKFDNDSNTFLAMNFNTKTATATLTGTNNVGATVEKTGYVSFDGGFKLAPESVVNVGILGSIDEALGYSFNIVYKEDTKQILSATICDMNAYENLGASAEFAPVFDKNGAVANNSLIVIGENTYKLLADGATDVDTDNYDGIVLKNVATNLVVEDVNDLYFNTSFVAKNVYYNYGKIVLIENNAASEGYDEALFYPYTLYRVRFIEAKDSNNNDEVAKFTVLQNLDEAATYYVYAADGSKTAYTTVFGANVLSTKPSERAAVAGDTYAGSRDMEIRGEVGNGDFVLAYYNADNNVLEVASSASVKTGRLTAKSGTTVTINGTRYNFGFLGTLAGANANISASNITATVANTNTTSLTTPVATYLDARIAALANLEATDANVYYAVMGNRVVWASTYAGQNTAAASSDYNFVLVDFNWEENDEADEIVLDANNNIVLTAVTESGKKEIKISALYDAKTTAPKDLENADAHFVAAGVETYFGEKSFLDYANARQEVAASDLRTWLNWLLGDVAVLAVVSEANGVYVLDVNADYDVADDGIDAITVATANTYAQAQFRNGTLVKLQNNEDLVSFGISASRLVLDKDATIVLFDGTEAVVNGVPENGAWINTTGATILAANSKLLVLSYADVTGMYNWNKTTSGLEKTGENVYVWVSGSSNEGYEFAANVEIAGVKTPTYNHYYNKVLNLATMQIENVMLTTTTSASNFATTAGNVTVVELDDNGLAVVNAKGGDINAYYAVACALGYNFGTLDTIGDAYEIAITGDTSVENRNGVTNTDYNFANGASINSYSVTAVYAAAGSSRPVTTAVVTDASTGTGANIFANMGAGTVYCLYRYNETADHMDVIAFVPAAVSQW